MHGPFKWELPKTPVALHFSHNPHWFLQSKVMGVSLLKTESLGWGLGVELGTPCLSRGTPQPRFPFQLLNTTGGCGTSSFCISAPHTSLLIWIWLLTYILSHKTSVQLEFRQF